MPVKKTIERNMLVAQRGGPTAFIDLKNELKTNLDAVEFKRVSLQKAG